jgi:hypothetical protein
MDVNDIIFYVLDLLIFIMLVRWLINCRDLEVKTSVGKYGKLMIPALFIIVAVIGWFKYEGTFKYVQTAALILFGVMYLCLNSGLSAKGIVMNGALTPWDKAGELTLSKKDSCLIYTYKKRQAALYFKPEELPQVREFLQKQTKLRKSAKKD